MEFSRSVFKAFRTKHRDFQVLWYPRGSEIHRCLPSRINTIPRPSQAGGHTSHNRPQGPTSGLGEGSAHYTPSGLAGKCEKQDWAEKVGCLQSHQRPPVSHLKELVELPELGPRGQACVPSHRLWAVPGKGCGSERGISSSGHSPRRWAHLHGQLSTLPGVGKKHFGCAGGLGGTCSTHHRGCLEIRKGVYRSQVKSVPCLCRWGCQGHSGRLPGFARKVRIPCCYFNCFRCQSKRSTWCYEIRSPCSPTSPGGSCFVCKSSKYSPGRVD